MKKTLLRLSIFTILLCTLLINNAYKVEAMSKSCLKTSIDEPVILLKKSTSTIAKSEIVQKYNSDNSFKCESNLEQNYTEEDLELLARLMYAEVGVFIETLPEEEAREAHILTGSVVLNRVRVQLGGAQTIEEVIYYHIGDTYQYGCVVNGTINNEPPEVVYEWAREILENGPQGPSDMIYQATFRQGTSTYTQIGNTYFCCKEGIDEN